MVCDAKRLKANNPKSNASLSLSLVLPLRPSLSLPLLVISCCRGSVLLLQEKDMFRASPRIFFNRPCPRFVILFPWRHATLRAQLPQVILTLTDNKQGKVERVGCSNCCPGDAAKPTRLQRILRCCAFSFTSFKYFGTVSRPFPTPCFSFLLPLPRLCLWSFTICQLRNGCHGEGKPSLPPDDARPSSRLSPRLPLSLGRDARPGLGHARHCQDTCTPQSPCCCPGLPRSQ